MYQRDRREKHSLIPVSQIFLKFPAFLSLLFYIVCLTVSKTIGGFHGKWIDGDTQHHISVHVADLFDHGIVNIGRKAFEK